MTVCVEDIKGVDIGEHGDNTYSTTPDGNGGHITKLEEGGPRAGIDALRRFPRGSTIVAEVTAYSSTPALKKEFMAAMQDMGHVDYFVTGSNVQSRRMDWYPSVEKTKSNPLNDLDSIVLCRIGQEKVISRRVMRPIKRTAEQDPVMLLRDAKYNVNDPVVLEIVPKLPAHLQKVTSQAPPDFAYGIGAAVAFKKKKHNGNPWQWKDASHRALTAIVVVGELVDRGIKASNRAVKRAMAKRGVRTSNLKKHVVGGKPYEVRKVLEKQWDTYALWVRDILTDAATHAQSAINALSD